MNIQRILLMVPPVTRPASFGADKVRVSPFFPLGLGYLAAVLRDRYDVRVLDCLLEGYKRGGQRLEQAIIGPVSVSESITDMASEVPVRTRQFLRYGLTDTEIRQQIARFRPDVVGVSAIFSASDWDAKNVCRIAKQVNPNIVTVLGGAHAGACAREIIGAEDAVDCVVTGEGEQAFPGLLRAIETIGKPWRIIHGPFEYIENLDTIPFPAWDLVNMGGYLKHAKPHDRIRRRPFAALVSSRGCPNRCSFCALTEHWGHRWRFRSPENVVAEVRWLRDTWGIREVCFEDDNLTADKRRAIEICRGLRDLGILWTAPQGLAVHTLDDELLGEMAASGCYSITVAVESGSQRVLRMMRKPVNLSQVRPVVESAHRHGLLCKAFFMLGYPGETKAEMEQTIEFAKSLGLDWAFWSVTSVLPHTRLWDEAMAAGYLHLGEFDPMTSFHQSAVTSPEWDADWVADLRERAISETCFSGNPNISRNPPQAIEDFGYVLSLYPDAPFSGEVRAALEKARGNL